MTREEWFAARNLAILQNMAISDNVIDLVANKLRNAGVGVPVQRACIVNDVYYDSVIPQIPGSRLDRDVASSMVSEALTALEKKGRVTREPKQGQWFATSTT